MANLYNLEPPPTAKVLLTTTAGEILLELFAKQTPIASRSFLQHCLDGYYNDTIFHRLVPGFIIQGGDPTGTGEGGASIYPDRTFEDEFHTRLKWNRRGLLGMANEGKTDTNGSQFFLSLGDCKELEGKNTMFGRVVGDTIYNLLKMADADMGEGERPLYPTKITGTEVLVNPYEDMAKREVKRAEVREEKKAPAKKGKRKVGKAILSFEDEEEGEATTVVKKKDFNPRLADSDLQSEKSISEPRPNGAKSSQPALREPPLARATTKRRRSSPSRSPPPVKRPAPATQLPIRDEEQPSRSPSTTPEPVEKMTSLLDKTNAQIAEMKASMKRTVHAPSQETKPKSALEAMMPATAVRGKKRKQGGAQTLDLLSSFKSRIEGAGPAPKTSHENSAPPEVTQTNGKSTGDDDEEAEICDLHFIANCESCKSWDENVKEDAEDNDDKAWMSHTLSFEKDRLGKDLAYRKKKLEELVVIDPRDKAQEIQGQERAKHKARMDEKGRTAWKRDGGKGR